MAQIRTLKALSRDEYEAKFASPMREVTATAPELVDLWPYANRALSSIFSDADPTDWDVEYVYESGDNSWQHILIPCNRDNLYLVVIVDILAREIAGHHLLDLRKLYGLDSAT